MHRESSLFTSQLFFEKQINLKWDKLSIFVYNIQSAFSTYLLKLIFKKTWLYGCSLYVYFYQKRTSDQEG